VSVVPTQTIRLPVARRLANQMMRLVATGVGVGLVLLALVLARRSPVSGAVVGVLAVGVLVATYLPLRVPAPLELSTDPERPGVLLPGSRAHPGLIAGMGGLLLLCLLVTSLPVVALVERPTLQAAVLAAVSLLACVTVALNLRSLGRAGRALVIGPSGVTVPELDDELVPWEQVRAIEVGSTYRRGVVPQHVAVVTFRVGLAGRRTALYSLDPVDLGPDPARTVEVLQRLARGAIDRSRLGAPDALRLFGQ